MAAVSEYAPACEVDVPGVGDHGPGWYLIAANSRVEAGPFATEADAAAAARWMDDTGRGVNPGPWRAQRSTVGLTVGARWRPTRPPRSRGLRPAR